MRIPLLIAAVALVAAVAFAQDAGKPPAASPAGKAGVQDPPDVKTQSYAGTLVDASCAGSTGGSAAADRSTKDESQAKSGAGAKAGKSAGGDQSCMASANTTQFAVKLNDGRTLKFDAVGNERAHEALKTRKKWTDAIASGKPIRVKTNGMTNGDQLTVLTID
jgi:hypothetical protein